MRVVFGLVRAFVWTTNRSYRVDISLGSSHRVFLGRALTGLHLDLRALFSQQVGAQGKYFACAPCLVWLGLLFAPLTVLIGLILGSGAHIACFSCGRWRGSIWTCAPYFFNKLDHKAIFRMRVVFAFVRAFIWTTSRCYRDKLGPGADISQVSSAFATHRRYTPINLSAKVAYLENA